MKTSYGTIFYLHLIQRIRYKTNDLHKQHYKPYKASKQELLMSIFLVFLCLTNYLWSSDHAVIFVHFGNPVPSCIFTTMKQARFLNPDCDLYLLADETSHPIFQQNHLQFLTEESIHLIPMDSIPLSKPHKLFHEVNKLEACCTKGYWTYASERFFALYDLMSALNLKEVVHLENDSMLYMNLEELLPFFKMSTTRLAAPFQSLQGCIPCFVFIKDSSSLLPLINHILLEMQNFAEEKPEIFLNDMQTLASFYRKFGPDFLMPLPTLMPEYLQYYPKKRSSFGPDNRTSLKFLFQHAHQFPSYLFDAAGLGIFINGNDPKYSPNRGPGTIHSRCLFNPSFFSFFWGINSQEQTVPYLSFKNKIYRIVNMHFHSKKPEDYASFLKIPGKLPEKKKQ